MTQTNEPNDRRYERALQGISRRVSRLEETQVTWSELNIDFNHIYDEIDQFKVEMNQRFDSLYNEIDQLKVEMNQRFDAQDAKIDIILRHITGQDRI